MPNFTTSFHLPSPLCVLNPAESYKIKTQFSINQICFYNFRSLRNAIVREIEEDSSYKFIIDWPEKLNSTQRVCRDDIMLETVTYLIGSEGPSGFGSSSTAEQVTEGCYHLSYITAIITGATSGIGGETARVLAKRGARLVLPGRSLKAAKEAKARILSDCPVHYESNNIIVMHLDLSSLHSVTNFVHQFHSLRLPLNLLINNAGKFTQEHAISEDGIEMTFATNYLGHFLLTKLLLSRMIQTARSTGIQGRIVNVSSTVHSWFTADIIGNLELLTRCKSYYNATRAYALSKLANVLHTKELARRLQQMKVDVTANCVHPGIVRTRLTKERGFITDLFFFFTSKLLKTLPQAAATTCYVASNASLGNVSGKYFADCNEASVSKLGTDLAESARLWAVSEIMVSNTPATKPLHHRHPFILKDYLQSADHVDDKDSTEKNNELIKGNVIRTRPLLVI